MKKNLFVFFISIFCFINIALSNAIEKIEATKKPLIVKYGVYIKELRVDFLNSNFSSDFYWWVRYDSCLSKYDFVIEDVENFEFVNCQDCKTDFNDREYFEETKETCVNYHTRGLFSFDPDFSQYPFDLHQLPIHLESANLTVEDLIILPDTESYQLSNKDNTFWGLHYDLLKAKTAEYNIVGTKNCYQEFPYQTNFGNPSVKDYSKYARATIYISINRTVLPYLTKILFPLVVILLLAYLVFYIPFDRIDIASGLTVTSLLGAVAFQITCSDDLPNIGYLCYIDKVFYLAYALIVYAMIESLITFYLCRSQNKSKQTIANVLEITSRFLYPIGFAVGCLYLK